jgi:hypothetical protein
MVGKVEFVVWVALAMGVVACAGKSDDSENDIGSSGVPPEKYLDELTPNEVRRLCEWAIDAQGGPGEKDCGDDTTVDTPTVEECATGDFSPYHCPVSMVEDCMEDIGGNPCLVTSSQACQAYLGCVSSSPT